MNPKVIMETQRTQLRRICADDFDSLLPILQDIEIMYAWEHAFSKDEVWDWINKNLTRYDRDGYSYWAVIEKKSERLVGVSGIIAETADGKDYVGLGYIFNKEFWHQGFALECANACKEYALHTLNVSLLTAQIRTDNTASRKVAEKLGMTVIKQFNRFYRDKWMPHLLYGCYR